MTMSPVLMHEMHTSGATCPKQHLS